MTTRELIERLQKFPQDLTVISALPGFQHHVTVSEFSVHVTHARQVTGNVFTTQDAKLGDPAFLLITGGFYQP